MRPLIHEITTGAAPEAIVELMGAREGVVLLRSDYFESSRARYSFLAANPFLTFQSRASICSIQGSQRTERYGNPWRALDELMARYESLDEIDLPFPIGGCFGFWGYDLKNFVEPKLKRLAENDLEGPDCWVGFYSTILVFDHRLGKTWIVATGLAEDGSRSSARAEDELSFWRNRLTQEPAAAREIDAETAKPGIESNVSRDEFIRMVRRAQEYIRQGDIYQVNVSHRLQVEWPHSGWELFLKLKERSPAPFSAYLHGGDFELASSSPELFLRMSGSHIQTRPIKGTRPRHADPTRDAQLSYELQTSAKEISELVMITDLLRNDLGRVCEYGSIRVPDLVHLERFPHVQHLVSTVEGRLKAAVTHFAAFSSCFPGGSITGAPKIRAMEIIDELEPISRGPYTGALGYLGFNRETQLSIIIRTALCKGGKAYFNVGAGIVADSSSTAEFDETIAKARGFFAAVNSAPVLAPEFGAMRAN